MDLDEISAQIEKIVQYVESVPEAYRERTFDFLIRLLEREQLGVSLEGVPGETTIEGFALPRQMSAFLKQFEIPVEAVQKMFIVDEEGVLLTHKFSAEDKNRPDIHLELACLLAAENAMKEGKFRFMEEDLKNRITELGLYDTKDFKKNLRARDEYFINVDADPIRLSSKGLSKLSTLFPEMGE